MLQFLTSLLLSLMLIQLVVQRLQRDTEFRGGSWFVTGVLFQHAENDVHLDLAQSATGPSVAD